MNITAIDLPNVGIVRSTIPADLMDKIRSSVVEIMENFDEYEPWNKNLAGQIRREFSYNYYQEELKEIILKMCQFHYEKYDYSQHSITGKSGKVTWKYEVEKVWINFQSKYEFNPMHTHNGILSFVVWVDIPYFLNFEHAASPGNKSRTQKSGLFDFAYTDILGTIRTMAVPADKLYEGEIIVFPSKLNHTVYPFYSSDKFRVSISGNIIPVILNHE